MKFKFYNEKSTLISELESQEITGESYQSCFISSDMLEASEGLLTIKCAIPIIDIQGYWSPDMFRPTMQLAWKIEFNSAAHRNYPFLTFFNLAHKNRASIGLGNLYDDAVICARMNQQTGNYDVEIKVSIGKETGEFTIFLDQSDRKWTEIAADYRTFVRPDWKPDYPEAAWLPVYCTWYTVHADLKKDWLEEQAETAAKMGFGTFIVDDGWCFDEPRRVTPETITSWYNEIGDWKLSDKKLPEFKQHATKVQALGLKYLLWVSPFMIGENSLFKKDIKCNYLTDLHEGYRVFDPACADAARHSISLMKQTVDEFSLDGLKIDFVDAIPQSIEKPHGRVVYNYMKTLLDQIRQDNPEALFEFRQKYASPLMLDLGTQFRAGDAPFDYIENLHRTAQIRVCLGDNVPVHADPVYWNAQESDINIARHMMCSLVGVPMVSADLNELPKNQFDIVRNWLEIYLDYLEIFKKGHWEINYRFDYLSSITVCHESEKITFLCSLPHDQNELNNSSLILNLGAEKIECKGMAIHDCTGREVSSCYIPPAGYARNA
jgi:alpha-galactosidase